MTTGTAANAPSRQTRQIASIACGCLLLLYAVLSYSAVVTKSATYDEPIHALGGYTNLHLGDFRVNFEDPALWHYWLAIPNGLNRIQFDGQDPSWLNIPHDSYQQWELATRVLYQTPGNNGASFINRSRYMMLLVALALGVLLAVWAWQLGGPIAAVIATALFSLDPNLIAHGSLIKNDLAVGLITCGIFFAAWHAGRRLTIVNALVIATLIAIGVNTKFSALLLGPMVLVLLAVRVLLPVPWDVAGHTVKGQGRKSLIAAALVLLISLVSFAAIWASYRFRFNPSPDPAVQLNTLQHATEAVKARFQVLHPLPPDPAFDPALPPQEYLSRLAATSNAINEAVRQGGAAMKDAQLSNFNRQEVAAVLQGAVEKASEYRQTIQDAKQSLDSGATAETAQLASKLYDASQEAANVLYRVQYDTYLASVGDLAPDRFIAVLNFFLDHHLLPSAWLHGVLFVHSRSLARPSFLMGEISQSGWWYYFPLAMLFKAPVGMLLCLIAALLLGITRLTRYRRTWRTIAWPLACLVVPFTVYLFSAITSNLNIGIRHVLPIYPFIYIAAGVLLAGAIRKWHKPAIISLAGFGLILLVETLHAFPNYIAFFSAPLGGPVGGFKLLSDSNLDWGQDLPLLAKWQAEHSDIPLAFGPPFDSGGSYFGRADPEYYGIHATPLILRSLPTDDAPALTPELAKTHVMAISATILQGAYGGEAHSFIGDAKPIAILGGTIYLYDLRDRK